MDWRGRRYYVVRFSPEAYDMRIDILKNVYGASLHCSIPDNFNTKYPDEKEVRGYYQILIGCREDQREGIELELRRAESRDGKYTFWKEIQRDYSKKHLDINGQKMSYRKCDIKPNKRCNHCMDC